jgi:hypothetical protein
VSQNIKKSSAESSSTAFSHKTRVKYTDMARPGGLRNERSVHRWRGRVDVGFDDGGFGCCVRAELEARSVVGLQGF